MITSISIIIFHFRPTYHTRGLHGRCRYRNPNGRETKLQYIETNDHEQAWKKKLGSLPIAYSVPQGRESRIKAHEINRLEITAYTINANIPRVIHTHMTFQIPVSFVAERKKSNCM